MTNIFKREFSAGCVVFKKLPVTSNPVSLAGRQQPVVFLLGKHSGYHKWVLPKGLIEKREKGWQTALRETEEEMGIRAKLVNKKPIHKIQYYYVADFKKAASNQQPEASIKNAKLDPSTRRVIKYSESGGLKVKVLKTVTFYLGKYLSGDLKDHGWEMEEAGWFTYERALNLMSFKGEKEALAMDNPHL
jgi:8-oxo-dGTP pyrophosphatase MutT (NUDIX family)